MESLVKHFWQCHCKFAFFNELNDFSVTPQHLNMVEGFTRITVNYPRFIGNNLVQRPHFIAVDVIYRYL